MTPSAQINADEGKVSAFDPNEWPDIDELDRRDELPSPVLPSACLPERLDKLAVDIACALGAPLIYVVVTLLVCVASLVGCWRRIRVTPGWVEPSTLAGVLVGPPGMLKSHVIDAVLTVLRLIEIAEYAAYEAFCKALRAKRDIVSAQEKIYRRVLLEAVEAGQPTPEPPEVCLPIW